NLTSGAVAQARAISTSAKKERSIGARNSAAIPVFRSRITRWKTSSANTKPKNGARPRVRSNACIRSASSTIGATRKCLKLHYGKKRYRKSAWAKSCEPSSSFILTRCGKLLYANRATDRQVSLLLFQQRTRRTGSQHVKAAEDEAKFWLDPMELAANYGFRVVS